jgi:predicted glycogen debranching enzyme
MEDYVLRMPWAGPSATDLEPLLTREWLVTNGLGGYASGTISGAPTRRYHGLLVAALRAPLGRVMMFNHLIEQLRLHDGSIVRFGGEEYRGGLLKLHGAAHLREFRLEDGLPVWCFELNGIVFEKRVFQAHLQNTVYVAYHLVKSDGPVRMKLRPSVHFRRHDGPVSDTNATPYVLTAVGDRYELSQGPPWPALRLHLIGQGATFTIDNVTLPHVLFRVEESRGYESTGTLWSPGEFRVDLVPGKDVILVASAEPWETVLAVEPGAALAFERERRRRLIVLAEAPARAGPGADLVLAADQFVITPAGRAHEAARAHAAGDEVRTIIAGYHWFTDWGRDTMISLEGLTLTTGRHREAGYILRTFAHYVRDGLIPNMFPEGEKEGLYHTADATLWFFHAIGRYAAMTGDRDTIRLLLPTLQDIVVHHLRGTRFGIGVDSRDGLLSQGQEGYQLTWMDAKVDGWVVTPRRGKAVEINALWYNALRLLEGWLREEQGEAAAQSIAEHAERARDAFNKRFWLASEGYLYDVVDGEKGDDPACRPNQILAISLDHPVLDRTRWQLVLDVVQRRLLTPVGLRSLAPGSPDYKPKYYGDLRSRDAAYHQGTVWTWLIGPFVDAWLRLHPEDRAGARRFLEGFVPHLGEACMGSISEIFDAEEPFTPRGCVAQAWSVAEVLRCWVKTSAPGTKGQLIRRDLKSEIRNPQQIRNPNE